MSRLISELLFRRTTGQLKASYVQMVKAEIIIFYLFPLLRVISIMDHTATPNAWKGCDVWHRRAAEHKTGENINLKLSAVYLICLLSNP